METPYQRNVLEAQPEFEIMLATWNENESSAIHDHGKANGNILVLVGSVLEKVFEKNIDGTLVVKEENTYTSGDSFIIRAGTIHSMTAIGVAKTLHTYFNTSPEVLLYKEDGATLSIDSNQGAWWPHER